MDSFISESSFKKNIRPLVGVGVLVKQDNKILLGKRKGSHGAFTWAPCGGHLEFGETVEQCARRELLEETSLTALSCTLGHWVENLMGEKHYISVFVWVDQFEGEPKLCEPTKCHGWQWFSLENLPNPLFAPLASFFKLNNTP